MTLQLSKDWSEFLRALISHHVKFVLIGGHAVAAWGEPRFTEDLDVLVEVSRANARRIRAALIDFGFGAVVPDEAAFLEKEKVRMLGRKPRSPSVGHCRASIGRSSLARCAAFCRKFGRSRDFPTARRILAFMKRLPPPEQERDERLREESEGEVRAKIRRARVAESQEKILAMYADTFRRLAE